MDVHHGMMRGAILAHSTSRSSSPLSLFLAHPHRPGGEYRGILSWDESVSCDMILGHAWGRERFIHIETSGFRFCPTEPYLEKDGKKSGAHRRVVNIH